MRGHAMRRSRKANLPRARYNFRDITSQVPPARPARWQDSAKPNYIGQTCSAGGLVEYILSGVSLMPKRKPKTATHGELIDQLSIRIDLACGARIGPGKVAVLEEIARAGSISAAGRVLRMSCRRTWMLVEELNATLGVPVVETASGGNGGGGAILTRAGKQVIECYRAIERDSAVAARSHLLALGRICPDK
jgi:molybdate transport system regulatory protein